jgi:hypothetical protein
MKTGDHPLLQDNEQRLPWGQHMLWVYKRQAELTFEGAGKRRRLEIYRSVASHQKVRPTDHPVISIH